MLGVINKSIQSFLCTHHGGQVWREVAERSGLGPEGFEAMLQYDDRLTEMLLASAEAVLGSPRDALLEDIGAWLAMTEPLRRLLRFGGSDYLDFLFSLDDLQGRGQMALPTLCLPELLLHTDAHGRFTLQIRAPKPGWGAVLAGLMRAMADDYGALVLIESLPTLAGVERVLVTLHDASFSAGRRFDLAQPEMRASG